VKLPGIFSIRLPHVQQPRSSLRLLLPDRGSACLRNTLKYQEKGMDVLFGQFLRQQRQNYL
jgi:hypothetical protein